MTSARLIPMRGRGQQHDADSPARSGLQEQAARHETCATETTQETSGENLFRMANHSGAPRRSEKR
ncbi:conserved hypothetical protein [Ricinus communis]|uniref:Uncharacterized protein n=1 Tax=Ricinus communis TaxID=3988 RepID=B9TPA0_RICCO|nr:conserved hypothetical protein [Ricinus communis]